MRIRPTGFALGGVGAQWDYAPTDRDHVRELITCLEDRRVLYNPTWLEVEEQVVTSVIEIRKEITTCLSKISENADACQHLRAMRAACRRFLDEPHPDTRLIDNRWVSSPAVSTGFGIALGELRSVFGTNLLALTTGLNLDLDEELASILPPKDQGI